VGYYTILASRLVGPQGSVIAIEPVIRNLFFLYQHIILNKAHNVTIVSTACADTLSVLGFSSGVNYAQGHLVSENENEEKGVRNNAAIVPTVTVDAVVKQLGFSPDVIKIDVEGAEYLVLKGAHTTILEAKPRIFLSVHSELLRSTCLKYLEGLGYKSKMLAPGEFLAKYTT
jgi:FkbM family methyltransferase